MNAATGGACLSTDRTPSDTMAKRMLQLAPKEDAAFRGRVFQGVVISPAQEEVSTTSRETDASQ
jgi:hypothetical protein